MFSGGAAPRITTCLAALVAASGAHAQQITDDAVEQRWSVRVGSTSRGMILYTDVSDVFLHDGARTSTVQRFNANDPTLDQVEPLVLGLGSGARAGEVIGAWRRGTDFAWIFQSGGAPRLVQATNPFNAANPMNPEGLAIADGCVFLILQAATGGNTVKMVFRVDPATAMGTLISGSAIVPGVARVSTSRCEAAWAYDDGTGTLQLQHYDGNAVRTLDSGVIDETSVRLAAGRVVYLKQDGNGRNQIFFFDTQVTGASAEPLTRDTTGTNGRPATDGRHAVWLHDDGATVHVRLAGGLELDAGAGSLGGEHPIQVQRGQLAWSAAPGALRFFDFGREVALDTSPIATFESAYLADGLLAVLGTSTDLGADREVFRVDGAAPLALEDPPPPILVRAAGGDASATLEWSRVLGATGHAIYLAAAPGVTKENYTTLRGGRRVTATTTSAALSGLANGVVHSVVVTSLEGALEGSSSYELRVLPLPAWSPSNVGTYAVHALAADPIDPRVLLAGAGSLQCGQADQSPACQVYRSEDSGATWTAVSGNLRRIDPRAVAIHGPRALFVSRDLGLGDHIGLSEDGGRTFTITATGTGLGETTKAVAIDPVDPLRIYAADLSLPSRGLGDSYLVTSTDGGRGWQHLPEFPNGELRAQALVLDPRPPAALYAGGSGTPNLVKSIDRGQSWSDLALPPPSYVYALALDPRALGTLYAGTRDDGVMISTDDGASWPLRSRGLPPLVYALVMDPDDPSRLYAGTVEGFYYSLDRGAHWQAHSLGLATVGAREVRALALSGRSLIAGTEEGIFVLDLAAAPIVDVDAGAGSDGEVGDLASGDGLAGDGALADAAIADAGAGAGDGSVAGDAGSGRDAGGGGVVDGGDGGGADEGCGCATLRSSRSSRSPSWMWLWIAVAYLARRSHTTRRRPRAARSDPSPDPRS